MSHYLHFLLAFVTITTGEANLYKSVKDNLEEKSESIDIHLSRGILNFAFTIVGKPSLNYSGFERNVESTFSLTSKDMENIKFWKVGNLLSSGIDVEAVYVYELFFIGRNLRKFLLYYT